MDLGLKDRRERTATSWRSRAEPECESGIHLYVSPNHPEHVPVQSNGCARDARRAAKADDAISGVLHRDRDLQFGPRGSHGQVSTDEHSSVARCYGGRREHDVRVALYVEEGGRAQVLVAPRVPGVDAVRLDREVSAAASADDAQVTVERTEGASH